MRVAIGADHAGFELKELIKETLDELRVAYRDVGTNSDESVDYPDYAAKVGRAVAAAQSSSMAAYPLTDLPKAYKVPAQQIDGIDAGLVHGTISEAVEKIRRGEGPQFVEAQSVRYPGSGPDASAATLS